MRWGANEREREREREWERGSERKKAETHFPAGRTGSQLWSWIQPIKPLWFSGWMHNAASEKSLWTSITGPYPKCSLSPLVLSIEQPSHNSPELWNWLAASVSLSPSLSDLGASVKNGKKMSPCVTVRWVSTLICYAYANHTPNKCVDCFLSPVHVANFFF